MFPLLGRDTPNPLELFQIWLNLPAADKLVEPHFAMLWGPTISVHRARDAAGRETRVTVVAGALDESVPPPPPPKSWAARPDSHVAIWSLALEPGISVGSGQRLRAGCELALENGPSASELLLLREAPSASRSHTTAPS